MTVLNLDMDTVELLAEQVIKEGIRLLSSILIHILENTLLTGVHDGHKQNPEELFRVDL